jgi:peptidoglycan hydrolase-like protein with peptidoglycan-binding domain
MAFRYHGKNWEGRDWRTPPSITQLGQQIDAVGGRATAADGTCASKNHDKVSPSSDHRPKPYSGPGIVRGIDATCTTAQGNRWTEAIRKSKDPRVKYVIFNGRIFSSYPSGGRGAWAWGKYTGSNPHAKHIHVSTVSTQDQNKSAWRIGEATGPIPQPLPPKPPSGGITLTITRTQIKEGSKTALGGDVAIAQGLLHAWGYGSTVGKVDGIFGNGTDAATKAFQKAKGLTQDGIIGEATWKALES